MKAFRIDAPTKDAFYNYSIQILNCTELAKKWLYQEMAKVSERLGMWETIKCLYSRQDNEFTYPMNSVLYDRLAWR